MYFNSSDGSMPSTPSSTTPPPALTYMDYEKQASARAARLEFLLEKSTIYARIIGDRMERQQIEKQKAEHRAAVRKENKEKKGQGGPTREGLRQHETKAEENEGRGSKRRRKSEAGREEKKVKIEEDTEENGKEVIADFIIRGVLTWDTSTWTSM